MIGRDNSNGQTDTRTLHFYVEICQAWNCAYVIDNCVKLGKKIFVFSFIFSILSFFIPSLFSSVTLFLSFNPFFPLSPIPFLRSLFPSFFQFFLSCPFPSAFSFFFFVLFFYCLFVSFLISLTLKYYLLTSLLFFSYQFYFSSLFFRSSFSLFHSDGLIISFSWFRFVQYKW